MRMARLQRARCRLWFWGIGALGHWCIGASTGFA